MASSKRRLAPVVVSLIVLGMVVAGVFSVSADQVELTNAFTDGMEALLIGVSPFTSPLTLYFVEGWRNWCLAWVDMATTEERANMAEAITVNALLQVDKTTRTQTALTEHVLSKLEKDLQFYEETYPDFKRVDYKPDDPDEERYFEHYQAIQKVVKAHANPLRATGADAVAAVDTLRETAGKGRFLLSSLNREGGFLQTKMDAYYQALAAFEKDAVKLDQEGRTPKQSLRLIVKNTSPNLVFFLQTGSVDEAGAFTPRVYTKYPMPIYPKDPPATEQFVDPKKPRGPWRVWLPVDPGDKIVIRAATMGPTRDRIRFMPIKGTEVRPDLNTLERGFYYLGYEVVQPTRPAPIVSRWSPVNETYSWYFQGKWEPLGGANDPKLASTPGTELRSFGLPLVLKDDRLEWTLRTNMDSIIMYGSGTATVNGTTQYTKVGPTSSSPQVNIEEKGSGKLEVLLERW